MKISDTPINQNEESVIDTITHDIYEIRVKGRLDSRRWAGHFEGMELATGAGESTVLRGHISDQAALYGLLSRLRNLNLQLLSVNQIANIES